MEEYDDDGRDERYVCDNCGEDGRGAYYVINMRGWRPLCICEECAFELKRYNE